MTASGLVLATRNPGKLAEFQRLLSTTEWQIIDLDAAGVTEELIEPGPGYAENASAKAERVLALTGLPALADDSGIEVDALGGWPGPRSARWMGPAASDADRLAGLRDEVERRAGDDRAVRYVAVVALADPGAPTIIARGCCHGLLVDPCGGAGFGYDPAFFSTDLGKRFGEASAAEKDGVSHRGRAVRSLLDMLGSARRRLDVGHGGAALDKP